MVGTRRKRSHANLVIALPCALVIAVLLFGSEPRTTSGDVEAQPLVPGVAPSALYRVHINGRPNPRRVSAFYGRVCSRRLIS
jgi:hypothetical protein